MEQQWGSDLSQGAIAMIHTKLQLDLQDVAGELDLMVHALRGMQDLNFEQLKLMGPLPAYTPKSAEDIVTEYLSRVFEHLLEAIEHFSKELREQIPVDIVVTVPTVRNSGMDIIQFAAFANLRTGMVLPSKKFYVPCPY